MAKAKEKKLKLPKHKKVSATLEVFFNDMPKDSITIGELRDALSGRAYGVLIFILALPNLIPAPTPGISAIVGLPLTLVSFQLMLGFKSPWLPGFIAKKKLKRKTMQKMLDKSERYLKFIEKFAKPRMKFLVEPPADRLVALLVFGLSLFVLLPAPFSNALPAFAICIFALGLLMRDGLFVILGIIAGLLSVGIITAFMTGVFASVESMLGL